MKQSEVLGLLRQSDYVSGEWISRQLGVTRAGVWKVIESLRAEGWPIESLRKKGYHLAPPENALWPVCIRPFIRAKWAGCRIDYFDSVDSTNRAARVLGLLSAEEAPHGTLVVADEQTAGRGRMTRSWQARPGEAALMSLLLRPRSVSPLEATPLVLVTALAACEACRHFGSDTLIKWPNDLVCGGKKLCGMLLDMNADQDLVHFAVAGIGLNISGFPYAEDLTHATCLNDACGKKLSRAEVTGELMNQFETYYELWDREGVDAILPLYEAKCVTVGSRVQVIGLKERFTGLAEGLLPDGSLRVLRDDGAQIAVHAGDVSVRGVMGYA